MRRTTGSPASRIQASLGPDRPFGAALDFPAAAPMDEVLFLSGRAPGHLRRR
jgi:hypothetical protein